MFFCLRDGSRVLTKVDVPVSQRAVHYLHKEFSLANEVVNDSDLYKADYIGSGTFLIKKPKRSAKKRRQSKLKGLKRGMRK